MGKHNVQKGVPLEPVQECGRELLHGQPVPQGAPHLCDVLHHWPLQQQDALPSGGLGLPPTSCLTIAQHTFDSRVAVCLKHPIEIH